MRKSNISSILDVRHHSPAREVSKPHSFCYLSPDDRRDQHAWFSGSDREFIVFTIDTVVVKSFEGCPSNASFDSRGTLLSLGTGLGWTSPQSFWKLWSVPVYRQCSLKSLFTEIMDLRRRRRKIWITLIIVHWNHRPQESFETQISEIIGHRNSQRNTYFLVILSFQISKQKSGKSYKCVFAHRWNVHSLKWELRHEKTNVSNVGN